MVVEWKSCCDRTSVDEHVKIFKLLSKQILFVLSVRNFFPIHVHYLEIITMKKQSLLAHFFCLIVNHICFLNTHDWEHNTTSWILQNFQTFFHLFCFPITQEHFALLSLSWFENVPVFCYCLSTWPRLNQIHRWFLKITIHYYDFVSVFHQISEALIHIKLLAERRV